jgi:hypothetical protein
VIKDVILYDVCLIKNWVCIIPEFLFLPEDRVMIEGELRLNDHTGPTIRKTLELWASKKGQCAKFSNCKAIFADRGWNMTADNLKKNKHRIWEACHSGSSGCAKAIEIPSHTCIDICNQSPTFDSETRNLQEVNQVRSSSFPKVNLENRLLIYIFSAILLLVLLLFYPRIFHVVVRSADD